MGSFPVDPFHLRHCATLKARNEDLSLKGGRSCRGGECSPLLHPVTVLSLSIPLSSYVCVCSNASYISGVYFCVPLFVTTELVSLQDEESARVLDVVEFDGKKGGFNANTHVENLYVAILPAGWRLTKWGAVLRTADLPRQDEPGHISCPIPSVSSPVPSHPVLPCSDPWPWAAVIAFHSHQSGVV